MFECEIPEIAYYYILRCICQDWLEGERYFMNCHRGLIVNTWIEFKKDNVYKTEDECIIINWEKLFNTG